MNVKAVKKSNYAGNAGALYGLCNGMSNTEFFSCGSDKIIRSIDLKNKAKGQITFQMRFTLYSLCFDSDRDLLFAGDANGYLSVLNTQKQVLQAEIELGKGPLFSIIYSKVHQLLIAASSEGSIYFVDSQNFAIIAAPKLCLEKVRCVDINKQETELAVACGDGSIRIFDLATQTEKLKFTAHQFSSNVVFYHPNGKYLLSGGKDAHLNIWQAVLPFGYELHKSIPAHNFAIYSLAFHPQNNLFATASRDKTVKIWDANSFDFLLRISKENHEGHVNSVNKIIWSKSPDYLISCGDDRSILVWDILEEEA